MAEGSWADGMVRTGDRFPICEKNIIAVAILHFYVIIIVVDNTTTTTSYTNKNFTNNK